MKKKVKVKILDSIAGLADPRPTAELDQKYKDKIAVMNHGREKPLSDHFVNNFIATMKERDRYGELPQGFPRDFAFKPGDTPFISEELAQKWEAGGICEIVADEPAAKKAA